MRSITLLDIHQAVDFLIPKFTLRPSIGIISGTGLECLRNLIKQDQFFVADKIPCFPSLAPTERALITGKISTHPVILLTKRLHIYEGFSMGQIAFVIRLFKELGVKILILTNAAGGINPLYNPGQILLITDHINLMGWSPLIGQNLDEYGPRFPDMTSPYDSGLIQLMEEASLKLGIPLLKGVYVGILGPNLETKAETRFLRLIGADAVGMSTVPEVITAVHCGIKCLGISVLSNMNIPDSPKVHTLEEIVDVVKKASPMLLRLLEGFFENLVIKDDTKKTKDV